MIHCHYVLLSRSLVVSAAAEPAPSSTSSTPAAAPVSSIPASVISPAAIDYVKDTEFSITKISYGNILTPLGVGMLTYGFGAYFLLLPGADVAALLLIYGFPISVLGFALSYAQVGKHRGCGGRRMSLHTLAAVQAYHTTKDICHLQ